ncbi:Rhodanese-like sulfurtransferase [Candidatus Magnetoovum chiemensis]|nr:Rhodanese-like sulfurtransferase [Candidatus Magnetoovum chiemensis]
MIEKQEDKQKSNLHNNKNSQILYILETAVSMEYRAFDLYRVMSERAEDDSLKEAFYSIAQAEKAHMNILVKAFEQYLPQLLRI